VRASRASTGLIGRELKVRGVPLRRGNESKSRDEQEGRHDREVLRGWTTVANADGYEELIRSTIFPHILDRGIDGLFRLDLSGRARFGARYAFTLRGESGAL
jgi:hypothetical protein